MGRVFIVEDSVFDRKVYEKFLRGHHELYFHDGGSGLLEELEKFDPSLAILDVNLPWRDGFEIYSEIRAREEFAVLPIFFISSVEEVSKRLLGLRLGADDFIKKHVDGEELRLRIRNRLAAGQAQAEERLVLRDKGFAVHVADRRVSCLQGGVAASIELSPIEFKLFVYMFRHMGEALSRARLSAAAWGSDVKVSGRSLDVHLCSLRKKLVGTGASVEGLYGEGYRLQVEDLAASKY